MNTIGLTIMATLFTLATVFIVPMMYSNTDASLTARWAVFLWLASVSIMWWVIALNTVGAITW